MKPLKINIEPLLSMNILWDNDNKSTVRLSNLRNECPCADCVSEKSKRSNSYIPIFSNEQLIITEVKITGNYAVNVIWGDGHDTGFYVYDYLYSISQNVNNS